MTNRFQRSAANRAARQRDLINAAGVLTHYVPRTGDAHARCGAIITRTSETGYADATVSADQASCVDCVEYTR